MELLSFTGCTDAVTSFDSFDFVDEYSVSSLTSSADLVFLWCVDSWLATIMVQSFVAVMTSLSSMDNFSSDRYWSSTSGMLFETLELDSSETLCRCEFEFNMGNLLASVDRL